MRSGYRVLILGALLCASALVHATDSPDPAIGTWRLNTHKSSGANVPRSETRTFAASGNGVAISFERVGTDGKVSFVQTTYSYDGKDYPVTGSPSYDSVSAQRVDAYTVRSTQKRAGKVVGTTTRSVSRDGKTLTLVGTLTSDKGETTTTRLVYDRI